MNKIIYSVIISLSLLSGALAQAQGQADDVAKLQQLPNTTIPTQCIDLNQDRICEA